ncbi:cysteine synthase A [Thermodesulfobacteriota bacterium]
MAKYFSNNAASIGRTPLIKINKICGPGDGTVLAKIEGRNPAYSVKDRIGYSMIRDAEERDLIREGVEIVEPTSGNTGIALAYVCAQKGYQLTLTMPETMSMERRKLLTILGARIILTPGSEGMRGAVERAEEMVAANPEGVYMPQQFRNRANPRIHEETTGPEIWKDTEGGVNVFVAGVGTGGTITGVSHYIKRKKNKQIRTVAVEPAESPVISQTMQGKDPVPGPHSIQGIGAGFVPEILDLEVIDDVELVSSEDAILFARRLAREEGILGGISSGAAIAAATRIAQRAENKDKTIVTILPSASERYLSTVLFDGLFDEKTGL